MERLFNLTNEKENKLSSLQMEKDKLRISMANPSVINNNAQEIDETKRSIKLLCEAIELTDDTDTTNLSAREILEDIKDHYKELKQDFEKFGKDSNDLKKDIEILDNIINNDVNESNAEQVDDNKTSIQEQEQKDYSKDASDNKEASKNIEDMDISDFSDFDDF